MDSGCPCCWNPEVLSPQQALQWHAMCGSPAAAAAAHGMSPQFGGPAGLLAASHGTMYPGQHWTPGYGLTGAGGPPVTYGNLRQVGFEVLRAVAESQAKAREQMVGGGGGGKASALLQSQS